MYTVPTSGLKWQIDTPNKQIISGHFWDDEPRAEIPSRHEALLPSQSTVKRMKYIQQHPYSSIYKQANRWRTKARIRRCCKDWHLQSCWRSVWVCASEIKPNQIVAIHFGRWVCGQPFVSAARFKAVLKSTQQLHTKHHLDHGGNRKISTNIFRLYKHYFEAVFRATFWPIQPDVL